MILSDRVVLTIVAVAIGLSGQPVVSQVSTELTRVCPEVQCNALMPSCEQKEPLANLESVPLNIAVKIGDGSRTVIEVADPDCPACRVGSAYLDTVEDLTRYIFLYPLSLHHAAERKARFIVSSKDPARAYLQVMAGEFDERPLPPYRDAGLLAEHMAAVRLLNVKGTPSYWVNGVYVSGADMAKLGELLGEPTSKRHFTLREG